VTERADSVLIVATGPSLRGFSISKLGNIPKSVHIIAVKGAIRYIPRADSWLTVDVNRRCLPFMQNRREGVHYYAAVPADFGTARARVQAHRTFSDPAVTYLRRTWGDGLPDDPGIIYTGNSGWGALQLAWHMGAKRVALLGIDGTQSGYAMDVGSPRGSLLKIPDMFEKAVEQLEAADIRVINGSPDSRVSCFQRTTPEDAIDWIAGRKTIVQPARGPSALILGGAESVWTEAREALKLFRPDAIFAVKDMIEHWPGRIDYGISLHGDRLKQQLRNRFECGYPMGFENWSHQNTKGGSPRGMRMPEVDRVTQDWSGSSGLLAVKIALDEGFSRIVLAGIPMDGSGTHFVRKRQWNAAPQFQKAWRRNSHHLRGKVRSMGGWTADEFGRPTKEWLA